MGLRLFRTSGLRAAINLKPNRLSTAVWRRLPPHLRGRVVVSVASNGFVTDTGVVYVRSRYQNLQATDWAELIRAISGPGIVVAQWDESADGGYGHLVIHESESQTMAATAQSRP